MRISYIKFILNLFLALAESHIFVIGKDVADLINFSMLPLFLVRFQSQYSNEGED